MGTNYYLICKQCEKLDAACKPIHIGKSSVGWNFIFRSYEKITTIEDWLEILESKTNKIVNEYDEIIENNELISIVLKRNNKNVDGLEEGRFFLDSKGFSFCKVDFS